MPGWLDTFEQYEKDLKAIDLITDSKSRLEAFREAERRFNRWMDLYPATESDQNLIRIQQASDHQLASISANSPEEKPEEMKNNTYFNEHSYTELLGKKPKGIS